MNIGWLQDFLTVAETGNFTRAAESRNASQAAFSRRIMALEAWLGVTLIDRSVFPTRLTAEGERFRDRAVDILSQMSEARTELSGEAGPARDQVRIALPHALATGRLAGWSAEWAAAGPIRYAITTGNVHDMVTALVAGGVDLLICFHNPQQPVQLSAEQYERLVIGRERLRPYAAPALIARAPGAWTGTARHPIPLLMYSPGAYLGRMVEQVLEAAPVPLHGAPVLESDMADVLRAMAVAGLGVAWLPDCTAEAAEPGALVALGDERWSLSMSIVAYRDRTMRRAAAQRLWRRLVETSASPSGQEPS
ncbi:MAG: LysR substrate-binding domain-containing protein [Caulobacteraceae bacterium]|nr:LysR substrate-binding domain-containing protein [Caulobacteraceae bacterium]